MTSISEPLRTLATQPQSSANQNFYLKGFMCIRKKLHLYPLWAADLQNGFMQFASDASQDITADAGEWWKWLANDKVECHFKSASTHETMAAGDADGG